MPLVPVPRASRPKKAADWSRAHTVDGIPLLTSDWGQWSPRYSGVAQATAASGWTQTKHLDPPLRSAIAPSRHNASVSAPTNSS